MQADATGLSIVQVRFRMVVGTTQAVAVRAYKDAVDSVKCAEIQIPPTVNPNVWYVLQMSIPPGALYWHCYSPFYAAWFGAVSGPLQIAQGTRLDIDMTGGGPWTATYTAYDPGQYAIIPPPES